MKKIIQGLSNRSEFIVIVAVTFGYSIYQSLYSYIEPGNALTSIVTQDDLLRIAATEACLGLIAFYILWARGWTRHHLHLRISSMETGMGMLLWLADKFVFVLAAIVINIFFGNALFVGNEFEFANIQTSIVLLLSVINPLFEEIFVVGYVVQALEKKHDPVFIISVSAFIRLLYHTELGPISVLVIPMGLLHAYVFWRWRRLWPLVVAHCIFNLSSLF